MKLLPHKYEDQSSNPSTASVEWQLACNSKPEGAGLIPHASWLMGLAVW